MATINTPNKLRKKYKTISLLCFIGQFVSAAAPFLVIGAINFDKYFVQYDGTKMSVAAIMTFSIMGLAIVLIAKKKLSASYGSILVAWAVMAAIFKLLGIIINDIADIMIIGWFGLLGAQVLNKIGNKYEAKALRQKKNIETAEDKMLIEAHTQEMQEKEALKEARKTERKRR